MESFLENGQRMYWMNNQGYDRLHGPVLLQHSPSTNKVQAVRLSSVPSLPSSSTQTTNTTTRDAVAATTAAVSTTKENVVPVAKNTCSTTEKGRRRRRCRSSWRRWGVKVSPKIKRLMKTITYPRTKKWMKKLRDAYEKMMTLGLANSSAAFSGGSTGAGIGGAAGFELGKQQKEYDRKVIIHNYKSAAAVVSKTKRIEDDRLAEEGKGISPN